MISVTLTIRATCNGWEDANALRMNVLSVAKEHSSITRIEDRCEVQMIQIKTDNRKEEDCD